MIFLILFIIILFLILILFSFPCFSPIPYFPTNTKDLPLILKALNLRNDQTVVDLGAGDGIVIFEAAKQSFDNKLNTRFIAIEINPILILILHIKRLLHPNRSNICILKSNIFSLNLQQLLTFDLCPLTCYLYISPWFIEKVVQNILLQQPKASFVSYYYPIKSLKDKEIKNHGINSIFQYSLFHSD